jgi:ABC-type multidrug transport system fused ATPase/permease subunit
MVAGGCGRACPACSARDAQGERLAKRLRERMYVALLRQDMGFFDSHRAGELTHREWHGSSTEMVTPPPN